MSRCARRRLVSAVTFGAIGTVIAVAPAVLWTLDEAGAVQIPAFEIAIAYGIGIAIAFAAVIGLGWARRWVATWALASVAIVHLVLAAELGPDGITGTADQLQIKRLKKKKLVLKDQITSVEDQLLPDIIA